MSLPCTSVHHSCAYKYSIRATSQMEHIIRTNEFVAHQKYDFSFIFYFYFVHFLFFRSQSKWVNVTRVPWVNTNNPSHPFAWLNGYYNIKIRLEKNTFRFRYESGRKRKRNQTNVCIENWKFKYLQCIFFPILEYSGRCSILFPLPLSSLLRAQSTELHFVSPRLKFTVCF